MPEKSLSELDLRALRANRKYFPSPAHWEDETDDHDHVGQGAMS
jgi:hypothetical protein